MKDAGGHGSNPRGAHSAGIEMAMDKASRLARAQAQGFDVSRPLYHGTDSAFSSFDPGKGERPAQGVYVTPDSDEANHYAQYATAHHGEAIGGSLYPVYTRGKMASDKDRSDALHEVYAGHETVRDADAKITANLRAKGFSGVQYVNGVRAIFDPKDIRSVNAAFDPSAKDKKDLLA